MKQEKIEKLRKKYQYGLEQSQILSSELQFAHFPRNGLISASKKANKKKLKLKTKLLKQKTILQRSNNE